MSDNAVYTGFYINLDRRPDRRASIEAEIARYKLGHLYRRFAACDGAAFDALTSSPSALSDGQKGCLASHYLLLKHNENNDLPLHIVEDDTMFGPCTEEGLRLAISKGWIDGCDILFTDTHLIPTLEGLQPYKTLYDQAVRRDAHGNITSVTFGVADLRHKVFATTSSFLVNHRSIPKLLNLYATAMADSADLPIDLLIRDLCNRGLINVGIIFPFITSVQIDISLESDIGNREPDSGRVASLLARQSFFIGCDWDQCRRNLQRLLPLPPVDSDPQRSLLKHILAYTGADRLGD